VLRLFRWLVLAALAAAVLLGRPWQYLPPQWNPWEPLAVDHPMTPVTQWKLQRLGDDAEQCQAVLEAAPEGALDYTPLRDYTPVEGCPLVNVVRISRTDVEFNASFTVTCPVAVAWVMYERQQLQPLAASLLGSRLQQVEHFGSFACRNIYHRADARRSQHALANAFDVAAFRMADGTRISVLKDWNNDTEPAKSEFLRQAHSQACRYFRTVLGPDYNQPHENHFHLEGSGFGFCR